MNIKQLFKDKDKTASDTTMVEVLGRDDVKQILEDFIDKRLFEADGIIIIWAAHNDVYVDAGGFSEAEALGAIALGQHMIIDKGIPRR